METDAVLPLDKREKLNDRSISIVRKVPCRGRGRPVLKQNQAGTPINIIWKPKKFGLNELSND